MLSRLCVCGGSRRHESLSDSLATSPSKDEQEQNSAHGNLQQMTFMPGTEHGSYGHHSARDHSYHSDHGEQEQATASLSDKEESSLRTRFHLLAKGKGATSQYQYLSSKELERLPELAANPLGNRIIEWMLQGEEDGLLSLEAFLGRMAVFSAKAGRESKMRLAFSVYDVDNDGNYTYLHYPLTLSSFRIDKQKGSLLYYEVTGRKEPGSSASRQACPRDT